MIRVKFEYNADMTLATYTILPERGVGDESKFDLYLSYGQAHDVVKMLDLVIQLSAKDARDVLLAKLNSFICSQQKY